MNITNINVNQLAKNGIAALTNNAPVLLTAFGAAGVVGTAVLTAKATFHASDLIREAALQEYEEGEMVTSEELRQTFTNVEKAKIVWPLYITPAVSGSLSVAAIVMSHRISSKRAAMLAAAYALNEKRIEEYQDKIKEKFGVKKEKEARDELQQEAVTRLFEGGNANDIFFNPLAGKVLIMEAYTGRPFWSKVEDIKAAANEVNVEIANENSVRISEFYDRIGLDHTSLSDSFGWNTHERLELDWTTTTSPDGSMAVHVFDYVNPPIMNPGSGAAFR